MGNAVGGIIKSLLFLGLIAGVIIGAKMFYFDPLQKQQKIQEVKKEISKLIDDKKWDEAMAKCDDVEKKYPDEKKFCNGRRDTIYLAWATDEYNQMLEEERLRSKAKGDANAFAQHDALVKERAQKCLATLDKVTPDKITRVEQQYRVICYGSLGQKDKAREAQKVQAGMSD